MVVICVHAKLIVRRFGQHARESLSQSVSWTGYGIGNERLAYTVGDRVRVHSPL